MDFKKVGVRRLRRKSLVEINWINEMKKICVYYADKDLLI